MINKEYIFQEREDRFVYALSGSDSDGFSCEVYKIHDEAKCQFEIECLAYICDHYRDDKRERFVNILRDLLNENSSVEDGLVKEYIIKFNNDKKKYSVICYRDNGAIYSILDGKSLMFKILLNNKETLLEVVISKCTII